MRSSRVQGRGVLKDSLMAALVTEERMMARPSR